MDKGEVQMKRTVIILTIGILLLSGLSAAAMQGHENKGHSSQMGGDMGEMGFKHTAVVDGVRSEFQIMSLASMKMSDDQGRTHHIMVKLIDNTNQTEIKTAAGKIKIIGPNGSEQISALQNYSGIFAANFTFADKGKYGVICLLKVDGQKKLFKFWYDHLG
jgi:hypothetical protein